MKPGKPTRLADKLNTDLNSLRQEHVDLINTQLTNFKRDLSSTVSDAQHTIASDIHTFQMRIRSAALQNTISAEQMYRVSPKTVTICVLTMILALMLATVFWQWAMTTMQVNSRLMALGLELIEADGATWIIPNDTRTRVHSCTMAGQPVTCIRVKE